MEALLSLIFKFFGGLGLKLLLIVGAFALSAIKLIGQFVDPAEKKLVDSTTNRTKDINIGDAASVRGAVDALHEDQISNTAGSVGPLDQNQVVGEAVRGTLNEGT